MEGTKSRTIVSRNGNSEGLHECQRYDQISWSNSTVVTVDNFSSEDEETSVECVNLPPEHTGSTEYKMEDDKIPCSPINRKVCFSDIEIREFPYTLGDHPGTGTCSGPPLTIEWDFANVHSLSVEEYEKLKPSSTCRENLQMSRIARRRLLTSCAGCSLIDLKKAELDAQRVLAQRHQSFVLIPVSHIEEFCMSAKRKLHHLAQKESHR